MKPIKDITGIKDPYTRRILSNLLGKDPFAVYKRTPATLKRVLGGLKDRDLRTPIAKGKWTVAQIVSHLCDAEFVTSYRYRLAISESGRPIQAYDQDKWADNLRYESADCRRKLDLFIKMREENIALLESLSPKEWKKYGMHEERGKETVERMLQMIAGHDVNHVKQIEKIGKAFRKGKG
jgi:hypothetical protein